MDQAELAPGPVTTRSRLLLTGGFVALDPGLAVHRHLAQQLQIALGDAAPRQIAGALVELAGRSGRLQLRTASIAIAELARRGVLDLAKLRVAAAGTPAASLL